MNNKPRIVLATVVLAAGAPCCAQAADFAPAGARATLSVEYRFESDGKLGPSRDKVRVLHEWQAMRRVDLKADLVARKPAPLPQMQAADAAQTARLQQQGAQMRKAQAQMAPMMAGAEAIVAQCGNDEKCMEREAMKMGAAMSGTQRLDDTLKTGRETAAALQPGADRYQSWQIGATQGSYLIEQSEHVVHADPGCLVLPGGRCERRHAGRGEGALPLPPRPVTALAAEVDAQAQTLTLQLPAPLMPLPYTEVVTGNEPQGTQVVPPGTHARQLLYRVTADGKPMADRPFTVALKGGWRSQSGEQVVQVKGDAADGGTLRVRWRFVVQ